MATDTRLWLVAMVRTLRAALQELIAAAVQRAEAEADILMPGYTHLQPAMTVRWSHWLLSHAAAWQRDDMRLRDLQPRVATLPLGSGASGARSPSASLCKPCAHAWSGLSLLKGLSGQLQQRVHRIAFAACAVLYQHFVQRRHSGLAAVDSGVTMEQDRCSLSCGSVRTAP